MEKSDLFWEIMGNLFRSFVLAMLVMMIFYIIGYSDPALGRRLITMSVMPLTVAFMLYFLPLPVDPDLRRGSAVLGAAGMMVSGYLLLA